MSQRGDVVRDVNGSPQSMLCIVQDITQQKHFENELSHAKTEAENANRAKSQFLSSMSHEIRTPLNAILGFAQLLLMEDFSDDIQENVQEINHAGKHLLELINDILDLSRIESGRLELNFRAVDLASLVDECVILLDSYLEQKSLKLEIHQDSLTDVILHGDAIRIKQTLLNLLSNACKYNRDGGTVTLHCEKDARRARIIVSDTGNGLTESAQNSLFEPFNRLGAENSEIEGTGIGLVISQQLVHAMGGNIGVESVPGEGSTFWFDLPTSISAPVTEKQNENRTIMQADSHNHTLLYIEDNPANMRLIKNILKKLPEINLLTAEEPQAGLDIADNNNLSLILLDINLPKMDGFQVLEKLRAQQNTRNIPVIAVSANAMQSDIDRAYKAGFNGYITKPIDIDLLVSEIMKHLQVTPDGLTRKA